MAHFALFPHKPAGEPLTAHPRGFRVIAGNPRCETWRHYASEDGPAFTAAGIWRCTEGSFAFTYQHWEFFRVLDGLLHLTPLGGEVMVLKAGDACVAEPGFTGTWTVVETMRKHFVTRYVAPERGG